MKQSDTRTFTDYLPVHSLVQYPDGSHSKPTHLRIDVSYHSSRKAFDLAVSPTERTAEGFERTALSAFQFATLEAAPRFNAKRLFDWAVSVNNQITRSRDAEYDPAWQLVQQVLAENELTLTTPATGKSRDELIPAILAAGEGYGVFCQVCRQYKDHCTGTEETIVATEPTPVMGSESKAA